jgi:hypothetical protein
LNKFQHESLFLESVIFIIIFFLQSEYMLIESYPTLCHMSLMNENMHNISLLMFLVILFVLEV